MRRKFYVPSLGIVGRLLDWLAYPVMRLPLLTYWSESPQLTHFWNNVRFEREKTDILDGDLMVACKGDPTAPVRRGRWDLRFHFSGWLGDVFGSWPQYVVLEPESLRDDWYVGWVTKNGAGVSRILIKRRVRMLLGPDDVAFFAIRASDHGQIGLYEIGSGRLGDHGIYRLVPLH